MLRVNWASQQNRAVTRIISRTYSSHVIFKYSTLLSYMTYCKELSISSSAGLFSTACQFDIFSHIKKKCAWEMADVEGGKADLIVRNGRILDPATGLDFIGDVAVRSCRVMQTGQKLDLSAKTEFDATGCLVTAGLIDCHIHGYQYSTPLGINVDEACLGRGVTTVVDAGSSGNLWNSHYFQSLPTPLRSTQPYRYPGVLCINHMLGSDAFVDQGHIVSL